MYLTKDQFKQMFKELLESDEIQIYTDGHIDRDGCRLHFIRIYIDGEEVYKSVY